MKGAKAINGSLILLLAVFSVVAVAATAKTFAHISTHCSAQSITQAATTAAQTTKEPSAASERSSERLTTAGACEPSRPCPATQEETTTEAEPESSQRIGLKLPAWTRPQRIQDASYFDDALFIGDSRLEDFVMYMELPQQNCYADVGLSVTGVFTKEFVEVNDEKLTAMQAVHQNETFEKAYLMFGLNELGWPYPKEFIKAYGKIIDAILQANPKAVIYVQSILPVTAEHDAKGGDENNEKIRQINKLLEELSEEKKVVYLDVAGALADENGCLPAYAAKDGVHMGKTLCRRWYEYLLSNTAKKTFFG